MERLELERKKNNEGSSEQKVWHGTLSGKEKEQTKVSLVN